ncbi:PDDEXK nuclease domain-containing protein [Nibricoccus sp. IMCC34717]|uniref:PDDEXK nuclease domain-containing protein n=1 Tax=Nibricoccus sp. IMCC34717 TaxID=3034021 RepID=UPI00384D0520
MEQVPSRVVFLTDCPARKVKIGKREIGGAMKTMNTAKIMKAIKAMKVDKTKEIAEAGAPIKRSTQVVKLRTEWGQMPRNSATWDSLMITRDRDSLSICAGCILKLALACSFHFFEAMTKRITKAAKSDTALPSDYAPLLAEIKARVQVARVKASLAANKELLALYWDIGNLILSRQKKEGWGSKVIDRLSVDLQRELPGQQGFSPRNLKYMRAFAEAWPEMLFVHQAGAQIESAKNAKGSSVCPPIVRPVATDSPIVHPPGAQLPWKHHCMLLDKLDTPADRLWYAAKAVEHGWSRDVLAMQIESGLHKREGKAVSNFKTTLPPVQSDLAQGVLKDPYLFDFLTLRDDANERALEMGLVEHVEKFLMELGAGFALVGRQVHLEVGDQDFYLDLLFYHLKLRCFVVIDLKAREFTPEAAGKMNFYLSAVDDRYRQEGDQPSIGLILCRSKNRLIAEYALRDMSKPIGVSGYVTKLVESLPKGLRGAIPSVAELEKGLARASDQG